ncbi:T cell receptor alpha chain MC.7.G5-like [Vicugna pacos]|uniref:T cell receptor alpha chain MC.7.G5-like n=1 Tax=Vicugna pacos TaxID=30538 RepID=UPI003BB98828
MHSATHPILLIFLLYRGTSGDSVTQTEVPVTLPEEALLILNCTYQTTYPDAYLFWYVQYVNRAPQLLLKGSTANPRPEHQGFQATLDKSSRTFHLQKPSVQTSDSAVYYCALGDTEKGGGGYGKLTFGQGTILTIRPIIQDPDPAVYQLRDSKSSDTTVCLYTDFGSQINMTQLPATDLKVFNSTSTVLDMGAIGSKSNGVLSWSNSTSFGCQDAFSETFYASEEFPCNPKLVEKSFETDISLNFQNLLVIAFRILLLKMVGFNLLMTLQLWSS